MELPWGRSSRSHIERCMKCVAKFVRDAEKASSLCEAFQYFVRSLKIFRGFSKDWMPDWNRWNWTLLQIALAAPHAQSKTQPRLYSSPRKGAVASAWGPDERIPRQTITGFGKKAMKDNQLNQGKLREFNHLNSLSILLPCRPLNVPFRFLSIFFVFASQFVSVRCVKRSFPFLVHFLRICLSICFRALC
jgi:hypothetical protein